MTREISSAVSADDFRNSTKPVERPSITWWTIEAKLTPATNFSSFEKTLHIEVLQPRLNDDREFHIGSLVDLDRSTRDAFLNTTESGHRLENNDQRVGHRPSRQTDSILCSE